MPDRLLKLLFAASPVRGELVHLGEAWRAMSEHHDYPPAVLRLLGQMAAAAPLLAASIKFNGALILQVHGDGPVKLMVVEVQPDLSIRATAKLREAAVVADDAGMRALINAGGRGRCAITLDPLDRLPGQQPYQGVVPLEGETLAEALEAYMRQSEQLDTRLWLAADAHNAAGLLLQRLPGEGGHGTPADPDAWPRLQTLAGTVSEAELLGLDSEAVAHRLFWQEPHELASVLEPRFACTCSRDRIGRMLVSLGRAEVDDIVRELGAVHVTCDFCNRTYEFDSVDAEQLFAGGGAQRPEADIRH